MLESSSRQKQYCDTKECYKDGDKICIHDTRRKNGLSLKVQNRWDGPYTVVSQISDLIFTSKRTSKGKFVIVHRNRLKPYFEHESLGVFRAGTQDIISDSASETRGS